ncbi:MAG: dodecin [Calditrichaceae bacterium]
MNSTYKLIEVVGTSSENYEKAIRNAIAKASESIKAISWYEVTEHRGAVHDGKVTEFQVTLKVGFKIVD